MKKRIRYETRGRGKRRARKPNRKRRKRRENIIIRIEGETHRRKPNKDKKTTGIKQ